MVIVVDERTIHHHKRTIMKDSGAKGSARLVAIAEGISGPTSLLTARLEL